MAKGIEYKATLDIISGGYDGELHGVDGGVSNWTEAPDSGSLNASYYYLDSPTANNNIASRVDVSITSSWTISVTKRVATIVVSTTVNSIVRSIHGTAPKAQGRDIRVHNGRGGALIWSVSADPCNTAHTILGSPIQISTRTITLEPGGTEANSVSTVYYWNHSTGYPESGKYIDEMLMGVSFRNSLPKDYRPGKIYNPTTGLWYSHNRDNGGSADVLTAASGGTWQEMRSSEGGVANDNPPLIYYTGGMAGNTFNMRLIGEEA